MSSYSGASTAEDQQMKRRAQKQKQKVGSKKGFGKKEAVAEKIRMPANVNAQFAGETATRISERIKERPDLPITTKHIRKWLKDGVSFKVTDDRHPTMDGEVYRVDSEGVHTPLFIHTVRIWTGMGYGIEIKRLPNGRVIVD